MTHNTTEIQQRLIALGYLPALKADGKSAADGTFGTDTLAAYNRFRASKGEGPHTGLLLLTEISADVFPEDVPAAPVHTPSIFDQIGTILSVISILKGKTMTADQLTGVVRAILALISGYFIARGTGDADLWNWIIAGVTGIIPVVWSWLNNRPKTIVPLSQKLSQ